MKIAIHQIQYMPGPRFFNKMKNSDLFILLDDVQFEKREFQNRNKIRTKDGRQYLTVPVLVKGRRFQNIKDVKINNDGNWREEHLKAIKINYSKAVHFFEYKRDIEKIYSEKYEKLIDIALESVYFLKKAFDIQTPLKLSSEFSVNSKSTQRLIDICKAAGADEYLSGAGGKKYLDEKLFAANNIKLSYQNYEYPRYKQVFKGFADNLSALDFLLNLGKKASFCI